MIQFNCHRCHRPLEVSEDEVGTSLQCPGCGYLIDVPTLNDIGHLQQDGTYEILESRPATGRLPDSRKLPSLLEHDEIDRRSSADEFLSIGVTPEELAEQRQEVAPGVPKAPKYDPITGELLTPIELKHERSGVAKPAMVALPASVADRLNPNKTLNYARHNVATVGRGESLWYPFIGMFAIGNLAVWLIMSVVLGFGIYFAGIPFMGILYIFGLFPLLMMMCIGHLGNVVEETGPGARDEVPVPLRQLSLIEDIWRPFVQTVVAAFLAASPILGYRFITGEYPPVWARVPLDILFFLAFPALLIASVCSGTLNNLLPNRAFGIIPVLKWRYLMPVGTLLAGFVALSTAILLTAVSAASTMNYLTTSQPKTPARPVAAAPAAPLPPGMAPPPAPAFSVAKLPGVVTGALSAPLYLAAVYLLHVGCWQMGLLYRRYNDRFPWVWQKHVKSDRTDMLAQLKNRREQQQLELSREAAQRIEEKKQRILQGAAQR